MSRKKAKNHTKRVLEAPRLILEVYLCTYYVGIRDIFIVIWVQNELRISLPSNNGKVSFAIRKAVNYKDAQGNFAITPHKVPNLRTVST